MPAIILPPRGARAARILCSGPVPGTACPFPLRLFLLSTFVCLLVGASAGSLLALDYAESSSGLATPALDGGRTELELADVDADGNLDIVSIGDHGNPGIGTDQHGIIVWFGDGAGSWASFQFGQFGYGGIAVGDVNNDGLADVGYGMHHNYSGTDLGDQLIEVALGDGTGRAWTPWDDGLATSGEDWGMFGTDFADIDNDGDLDLGSVSFGCCAGVHVYLNQGDGTWVQSFGFIGGNSHVEFEFGDVDADGNADFAVGQQMGTVYRGDGAGGFALADDGLPVAGIIGRRGPDLGDADGDGADELSFVNDNGGVEVYRLDALGAWQPFRNGLPATGTYGITQLCDMNGDGLADVVAFGAGTVSVWRGNGAGTWFPAANFIVGTGADYQALRAGGDADHNGLPDIAVVGEEGSFPSWQNHLRFYRETSVPTVLAARVVEPGGGETWVNGAVRFVDWEAAIPAGALAAGAGASVRLELSTAGAGGPWTLIADALPDNGRHQWNVAAAAPCDSARIRVTVAAGADSVSAVSDPFRIVFPPGTAVAGEGVASGGPAPATPFLTLHPNPTSGGAWIQAAGPRISSTFARGVDDPATVRIHDVSGRLVMQRTLPRASLLSSLFWDGRDAEGRPVPSGIYLVTVSAGGARETRRLVVVR